MRVYIKKAIGDIFDNRFLNTVTILTIAFSILIVSAFSLFLMNTNTLLESWRKGVRVMVYLKPTTAPSEFTSLKTRIEAVEGVAAVVFIPRAQALKQLKTQMQRQASLLDRLEQNPLPDAFEIRMVGDDNLDNIEKLARKLERLVAVEEVEYGQKWLGRFSQMIRLFSLAGYILGGMFLMAAIFFVANTVRLVIYSRRDEIEVMRLVGAEAGFIKMPFYVQGLIQGFLGGVLGLAGLFAAYLAVSSQVEQGFGTGAFEVQFLSTAAYAGIILASMFVGWLGCYVSLKQFLNP